MNTVFLMIARLLYDKGYGEYVEAARMIRKEYPSTEFQLLGSIDTEYPNHVPENVVGRDDAEGVIRYLGYRTDVLSFIRKADCIVLPSSYNEGLSRVLIEALAIQKPVITTDIPGCRETVEQGYNGYLIPTHDADALASAIRRFLLLSDEERVAMGRYGRRKAERQFDVRDVIIAYRKITERFNEETK